ncbi:MAG: hypothetical protein CME64_17605 [Halobacteriovoraceae bacterium]|nr:hypothetical protein [Halobacteriovoraceae bacterium]|tara:strand:+ start:22228 stop:23082 length:855 start_codon:yes stop_codon:yes gene_type:complete
MIKYFKQILNQKGVSAMELVVGLGIAGGIGLMMTQNMKTQQDAQNSNEESRSAELAIKSVMDSLKKKDTCENVLSGLNVNQMANSNGLDLTMGQLSAWRSLSANLGSRISLEGVNAKLGANAGRTPLTLTFEFKRPTGKSQSAGNTFKRGIKMDVSVEAGDILCEHVDESGVALNALEKICLQIGGVFTASGECEVSGIDPVLRERFARAICDSVDKDSSSNFASDKCIRINIRDNLTTKNVAANYITINGSTREVFDNSQCSGHLKGYTVKGEKVCGNVVFDR